MKLDLLTQIPQIVGRLRDSELNKNIPIILVPNKVDESQTFEMFKRDLQGDLTASEEILTIRETRLQNAQFRFNGINNYSVERFNSFAQEVKDKPEYYVDYNNKVSTNKLYYQTNLNKWDVKQQGVLSVYNEEAGIQQAKYSEVFEMKFKYEPSHNMPTEIINHRLGGLNQCRIYYQRVLNYLKIG